MYLAINVPIHIICKIQWQYINYFDPKQQFLINFSNKIYLNSNIDLKQSSFIQYPQLVGYRLWSSNNVINSKNYEEEIMEQKDNGDWLSAQQAVRPDGTEVTNLPLINKKLPPLSNDLATAVEALEESKISG